ncbi:MAG TPA: hypothetical protein VIV60_14405 [Polyangiaceae bacterium]
MASENPDLVRHALESPGGFAWWYLDLLDATGNGLVVIWALGLPFLPESRKEFAAVARPSVNVALYRSGREALYLLQEHPPEEFRGLSSDGAMRIGRSHFEVERSSAELTLRATLDEAAPDGLSRLRGSIELRGRPPELAMAASGADHVWTPRLLHAAGHASISLDGRTERITGVGYFDGNASFRPLHAQGIDSWRWARLWIGDRSFVVYDVAGRAATTKVFEGAADGSLRELPVAPQFSAIRTSRYGIGSPRRMSFAFGSEQVSAEAVNLLEDGPFYQRHLLNATLRSRHPGQPERCTEQRGVGIYEVVLPGRVDVPWQRPLLRMRTHRVGGSNSSWLPLFSGWSESRGRRLLTSVRERLLARGFPESAHDEGAGGER